ncbi:hypothetical protein PCASD_23752 [Puccinia coronata f. sp. avenae]|uniref:Uncharacterized protein n=1 Tax=Puccinia coronata f. sp. avenae TaxID=200324 RepID=A0A2N5TN73_9BASI|nr:hypothetical protein PCASD_23752 [Puccinia coronata f. sp. avenae]
MEAKGDKANSPASAHQDESSYTTLTVLRHRVKFDAHEWLQKVIRDVAGFVVITSRNKKAPVAISGGTIVGERFLDLHAKTIDPCANFVAYQEGQAVIKTISGLDLSQEKQLPKKSQAARKEKYSGPHSQGGLPENRAAVAKQLGQALNTATGGKYVKGWPGTSTIEVLKKLKITLKVNAEKSEITCNNLCMQPWDMQIGHTDCVLTALANGWVELISHAPEAMDKPAVVGYDPKDNSAGAISKSFVVGPARKRNTASNAVQKNVLRKRKPTSSATGPASKRVKRKKKKSCHSEDSADLDDKEAGFNYEEETDSSDSGDDVDDDDNDDNNDGGSDDDSDDDNNNKSNEDEGNVQMHNGDEEEDELDGEE